MYVRMVWSIGSTLECQLASYEKSDTRYSLNVHLLDPRSTEHDIKVLFLADHSLVLLCLAGDGDSDESNRLQTGVSSSAHSELRVNYCFSRIQVRTYLLGDEIVLDSEGAGDVNAAVSRLEQHANWMISDCPPLQASVDKKGRGEWMEYGSSAR